MVEALEGIVVKEIDYKETSKLLKIITKKYGIVDVISKGCKNVKSPLRSVSTKLIYGTFHLHYKENKLSVLQSVDVIDTFKNIRLDYDATCYASLLLETSYQVMEQHDNENIYNILIESLYKIEEGFDPIIITDIASLKLLEYLGVMPVLDSCAKCGSTKSIATLSSDAGGYVCNNCRTNEPIVNEKTIKLIRMLYYVDISKISKLDISDDVKKEIHNFIDRYYDRYTGLRFKTKKLLKGE